MSVVAINSVAYLRLQKSIYNKKVGHLILLSDASFGLWYCRCLRLFVCVRVCVRVRVRVCVCVCVLDQKWKALSLIFCGLIDLDFQD